MIIAAMHFEIVIMLSLFKFSMSSSAVLNTLSSFALEKNENASYIPLVIYSYEMLLWANSIHLVIISLF